MIKSLEWYLWAWLTRAQSYLPGSARFLRSIWRRVSVQTFWGFGFRVYGGGQ